MYTDEDDDYEAGQENPKKHLWGDEDHEKRLEEAYEIAVELGYPYGDKQGIEAALKLLREEEDGW